MAFTKKNEEAVSPVIGVILMVAITVILAAVIAAFVFGMAGNIQKTKVVAATVQRPSLDTVVVTYQGGQDAGSFSYAIVTMTDEKTVSTVVTYANGTALAAPQNVLAKEVGSVVTGKGAAAFVGKVHVVVVATFNDASSQVIMDSFV